MEQMDFVEEPDKRKPARRQPARSSGPRTGCKRLTADIPADLHKRLKMLALTEDSTVTDIVIKATKAWLANRRG